MSNDRDDARLPGPGPGECWSSQDLASLLGLTRQGIQWAHTHGQLGDPARYWHGRQPLWTAEQAAQIVAARGGVAEAHYREVFADRSAVWRTAPESMAKRAD